MNIGMSVSLPIFIWTHKKWIQVFCFLISHIGNIWATCQSLSPTQEGEEINVKKWYRGRLLIYEWARPFSLEILVPTDVHKPKNWLWRADPFEITRVVKEEASHIRKMYDDDVSTWKSIRKSLPTFNKLWRHKNLFWDPTDGVG